MVANLDLCASREGFVTHILKGYPDLGVLHIATIGRNGHVGGLQIECRCQIDLGSHLVVGKCGIGWAKQHNMDNLCVNKSQDSMQHHRILLCDPCSERTQVASDRTGGIFIALNIGIPRDIGLIRPSIVIERDHHLQRVGLDVQRVGRHYRCMDADNRHVVRKARDFMCTNSGGRNLRTAITINIVNYLGIVLSLLREVGLQQMQITNRLKERFVKERVPIVTIGGLKCCQLSKCRRSPSEFIVCLGIISIEVGGSDTCRGSYIVCISVTEVGEDIIHHLQIGRCKTA